MILTEGFPSLKAIGAMDYFVLISFQVVLGSKGQVGVVFDVEYSCFHEVLLFGIIILNSLPHPEANSVNVIQTDSGIGREVLSDS